MRHERPDERCWVTGGIRARIAWLFSLLCVSSSPPCTGFAERTEASAVSPISHPTIEVIDIFMVRTLSFAAVRFGGPHEPPSWREVGDRLGDMVVQEISPDRVTLAKQPPDSSAETHTIEYDPEALNNASRALGGSEAESHFIWLNSDRNPMFDRPYHPSALTKVWMELSDTEKSRIKEWWFSYGWSVEVVENDNEVMFTCINIFEEYRRRVIADHFNHFMGSLSAEQIELFYAINTEVAGPGTSDEEMRQMSHRREAAEAAFLDTLATEQVETYHKLTKDWKAFFRLE